MRTCGGALDNGTIIKRGTVQCNFRRCGDVNGKNSKCTNTQTDQIQNRFIKGSDGKSYILATALEDKVVNNVQFSVEGLPAGKEIKVLFEDRTMSAGAGTFTDNFPKYGRHVYQFADNVPVKNYVEKNVSAEDIRILQSNQSGPIFSIDGRINGVLHIYSLTGQLITILKENHSVKKTEWKWNRIEAKLMANRMYIFRLNTSTSIITKSFVLMAN